MHIERRPEVMTERICVRLLEPHESALMTRFRVENKSHLEQWEPRRSPEFFTEAFWHAQIRSVLREFRAGNSVCFAILNHDQDEVLGVCNYTNIIRGTFQSCHLGYALAKKHQGKGLMSEALGISIRYMFLDLCIHRIMANYLERNERSATLLKHLGFEIEGLAKQFLLINGRWEDHVLTSLINTAYEGG